VQRWKLFLQDYDFDIHHVPGEENIVADALSRFVESAGPESQPLMMLSALDTRKRKLSETAKRAIREVHCSEVGHHGVDRTMHLLKLQGKKWNGMKSDVRYYIHNCDICQRLDFRKPNVVGERFTLSAEKPYHKLYIDTIGPLPPSQNKLLVEPYQHILVIVDAFSRFTTLIPLCSVDGEEAVAALHQYLKTFPSPEIITTDRGTQFMNKDVEDLLRAYKVKHQPAWAYSKEENGMVERSNREVMRHLRAFIYEKRVRESWHSFVPDVQMIMNDLPSQATGEAPTALMFAASQPDMVLSRLNPDSHVEEEVSDFSEWRIANDRQHAILVKLVAAWQREMDEERMKELAGDASKTVYPDGSYVMALPPRGMGGQRRPSDKLKSYWKGPFEVKSHLGNHYVVQSLVDNSLHDYTIYDLKPYTFEDGTDLKKVAIADADEYLVEAILEHRWSSFSHKKSTLEFKIRWTGFGPEHDSWEPWKLLRTNSICLKYCEDHYAELKEVLTKKDLKLQD
jgi:hypothetical protein